MRMLSTLVAVISLGTLVCGGLLYSAGSTEQDELSGYTQSLSAAALELQDTADRYGRMASYSCDMGEVELCINLEKIISRILMIEAQGRQLQRDLETLEPIQ